MLKSELKRNKIRNKSLTIVKSVNSAMSSQDDGSVHRLEGSAPSTGGLVVKKKDADGVFKVPKPSLLGLDRLAAEKRKERDEQKRLISFKTNDHDDDDDGSSTPRIEPKTPSAEQKQSRHYRSSNVETPSQ